VVQEVVIATSTSEALIGALHERALPEVEYVFAVREPVEEDQLVVWEHGVVPAKRQRGVGSKLMRAAAKAVASGTIITVDPTGEFDPDRMVDYYRGMGFAHSDRQGLWATATEVLHATDRQDQPLGVASGLPAGTAPAPA